MYGVGGQKVETDQSVTSVVMSCLLSSYHGDYVMGWCTESHPKPSTVPGDESKMYKKFGQS